VVYVDDIKFVVQEFSDVLAVCKGEEEIKQYLKLKPQGVFVDIGAHKGKYALRIAKLLGSQGKVIAIEPDPQNYECLLKSIKINGFTNIVALNIAAFDKSSYVELSVSPFNSQLSSIKTKWGWKYIKVKAELVDEILNKLGIKCVDMVKIDVEGAEYEVLLGMKKTLLQQHPKIIIEVSWENFSRVTAFLKDLGYTITPIKGLQTTSVGYFYCC